MIKKLQYYIYYWGPPLVWMGCIFLLSSRQRVAITHTATIDFLIFKSLHIVEYALLYLLLYRALSRTSKVNKEVSGIALLFSILYAFSDEFHQTFVPTREGHIRDVFIDTIGILAMYVLTTKHLKPQSK